MISTFSFTREQRVRFYDHLNIFSKRGAGDQRILTLQAMHFFAHDIYRILPTQSRQSRGGVLAGQLSQKIKGVLAWAFKGMISLPNLALSPVRLSRARRFPTELADALIKTGVNDKTTALLMEKMPNRLLFDKAQNLLMTIGTAVSIGGISYRISRYETDATHRQDQTLSRIGRDFSYGHCRVVRRKADHRRKTSTPTTSSNAKNSWKKLSPDCAPCPKIP